MSTATRPGPRERLLTAAAELTDTDGITVGVDAILRAAGVARRSLYQHFGSKDGLLAEMLTTQARATEQRYRSYMDDGGDDPKDRIRAEFAGVAREITRENYHGCRFIAAKLSLATVPGHDAVRAVVREHKDRMRAMIATELDRARHPDAKRAAAQLAVLANGLLVTATLRPIDSPLETIMPMVEQILAEAP